MASHDQKTEQPTQRRRQKAREEGNYPSARVFVGSLQFLAFVAALGSFGGAAVDAMRNSMAQLLSRAADSQLDPSSVVKLGANLLRSAVLPLVMVGAIVMGVTLAAQLVVTGLGFSLTKLMPDAKRLNPISRIKEMPRQNLGAAFQAALMLPVFAWAVYALLNEDLNRFLSIPLTSVNAASAVVGNSIQRLLWRAAWFFIIFGAVDLFRQKRRYQSELRMTKQEIRDEHKEVEGNPMIKSRIRRLRIDASRRRMMHQVPKASVVIVNPTHYAVALQYGLDATGAPKVVAKGKNYLALRIRQIATENQVPLVENPPLAQALYKTVDIGQEIPSHFYKAVAEVLAYIYRLMNARVPG